MSRPPNQGSPDQSAPQGLLAAELAQREGFGPLKAWLIAQTGLAYYADKDEELSERLAERMSAHGFDSPARYLAYLQQDLGAAAELAALIERLTIGETYFFRYREQFDALREGILPQLLAARPGKLRIWSAGCASGEETYSLAILIQQLWPELADDAVEILGSDINRAFLAKAEQACYREWSFRQSEPGFRERCFEAERIEGQPCWSLRPAYRSRVRFASHNLIQDDPGCLGGREFDLIFCRNVLIYFDAATQRQVIQRFHDCLRPSGWLVLGPSELSPLACRPFEPQPMARLSCYQKAPLTTASGLPTAQAALATNIAAAPAGARPGSVSAPKPGPSLGWVPPELPSVAAKSGPVGSGRPAAAGVAGGAPGPSSPGQEDSLGTIRELADRGRLDEAEARCREQILSDGLNPALHYALAQLLLGRGRDAEALESLQRTLYLDHRHALAHYRLGLMQRKRGQAEAAARSFRNAERLLAGLADEAILFEELSVAQLKDLLRRQGAL